MLSLPQTIKLMNINLTKHGCVLKVHRRVSIDKTRTVNLSIHFLTQVKTGHH